MVILTFYAVNASKETLSTETAPTEKFETIYFDPETKSWNDQLGICHTCTDANGFTSNGQIKGREIASWIIRSFRLTNDMNENPPVEEVRQVFARFYSLNPSWFGAHVELNEEVYKVIMAVSKPPESQSFTDPQGNLAAYYTVNLVTSAENFQY